MQKLIAYDHLEGDPGLENGKNGPLFTDILNMVCSCVDNSSPDRYIVFHILSFFLLFFLLQKCHFYDNGNSCSTTLQVLKVLLTAVASAKFRGNLNAFKGYLIFLLVMWCELKC